MCKRRLRSAAAARSPQPLLFLVMVASMALLSSSGFTAFANARLLSSEGESMQHAGRVLLAGEAAAPAPAAAFAPTGCSLTVATPAAPAYVQRLIAEPYKPTTFDITYTCLDGSQYATMAKGPHGQVAYGSQVALTYTAPGLDKLKVYVCPLADANPAGGRHWCAHAPKLVSAC
eukprot:jgi/Mesen1/3318/ME000191S02456